MRENHLVYHGVAIKRHSSAEVIAELIGLPIERVTMHLREATESGRAVEVQGGWSLQPLTAVALSGYYAQAHRAQREDAGFRAAYDRFELINRNLKQVITDWQTITVGGEAVPNSHDDEDYDGKIIDRLGTIHEQVEGTLKSLSQQVPRIGTYLRKLTEALEKAEDGDIEWVSDIRRESYHTVWFELHEELLRIMGTERDE